VKRMIHPCDDQRLSALLRLEDDSPAARGADIVETSEHVESCHRCQTRLAELAADADEWADAKQLLTSSEAADALEAERQELTGGSALHSAKASWTEAMARQLLDPPSHPEMLGRLGRYSVERLIGSGGMGVVFKGFDTELNRPVAIKVLAPHLAGNGSARQRFAREARAAAAVVHEHVVAIHNVESDAPAPFLVMQFVAGESLQTRLDRQGPLTVREILRIGRQTAAGLAAAHAQGLVHRDVKPSNIMLEQGVERALLTDFGLARAADDASLTHTGYLPGTPHYMSPEQARGETVDSRSDLFSLGSVLYALATGRPPFRADTSFGVLRRITDTQPRPIRDVNPDIPAWLSGLIDKLLSKNPEGRFASASDVSELLEQCLAHVQQPATVPLPRAVGVLACHTSSRVGQARLSERRPTLFLTAAVTLLLSAFAAIYFSMPKRQPLPDSQSAAPQPPAPSPQPLALSPSDLEWNSAADEIQSLTADVDLLEQQASQLWDVQPVPIHPTTQPPAEIGPEPEIMP
jgi:serine/threonine protein kinase